MRKILLAFCFLAGLHAGGAFAQSMNCATATSMNLSTGSACVNGTNAGAITDNTLYGTCNASPVDVVWYTYVANGSNNNYTITPGTLQNAEIIIYTGNCPGQAGAQLEYCTTASGGNNLVTTWGMVAGQQVWVGIASTTLQDGTFQLCITSTPPAPGPGNTCAQAIPICAAPFNQATIPSNSSGQAPACFGSAPQQDIFVQFTITQSGLLAWTATCPPATEYDWALWNITNGCPGTLACCNYNYAGGSGAGFGMQNQTGTVTCGNNGAAGDPQEFSPAMNVTCGQTYALQISNYSNNNNGFTLNFTNSTAQIGSNASFTVAPTLVCGSSLNAVINDGSTGDCAAVWDYGDGSANYTGGSPPNHTYTTPGTYAITETIGGACPSTHTEFVQLLAPLAATVTATNTGCSGGCTGTASVTAVTGGDGIYTYSWAPGGQTTPTLSGICAGTYTATVSNALCGTTVTQTVNVISAGSATLAVNSATICSGGSTTLTANGTSSYTWSPATGLSTTSGSVVTANPASTTVYTVTGANGSCTATATSTVNVTGTPTVNVTNGTVCNGSSTTLTASGATSYTWSPATGLSATTGSAVTASPGSTTVYTVTGANGTCTSDGTSTVTVVGNPTVTVNTAAICAGQQATLTANGASTYAWSPATGLSSTSGSVVTASPGTTTVYTITGTAGTCTAVTTTTVDVNPLPVPAFVSSTECLGTPTAFTNNSTPAGSTYAWNFGDGNTSTALSPSNTYSAAGSYVASLTVTAPGTPANCTASITGTVTVKPIPVLNPVANISVCDQQQIAPAAFVTAPAGATVGWNNSNTAIGLGANGVGNIAPFTGTSGGSPSPVSAFVTAIPTLNGCVGQPVNFTLTVLPQPTITLASPPITCPGQLVPAPGYTLSPNDPMTTYNWTNNNTATGLGGSGTGIPPSFTAGSNQTLSNITSVVTVTPAVGSCVGAPASYTVTIHSTPVINPIADAEFCPNENAPAINFSVMPAGGSPSFTWLNSNPNIGLAANGNGSPLPSFTTANAGTGSEIATISVSASLNGCPGLTVPFTITIHPNPIANFFSSAGVCSGSPMSFTDQSSIGTGSINQWSWSLNASGTPFSNAQNPQQAIQPAGTHSVTLAVSSDKGCTSSVTKNVYINYIPQAAFTGGGQGCPPLSVITLSDVSTVTGPAQVSGWQWDLGNGATSTAPTPGLFTYGNSSATQNAVYTVSLIVTSDSGCVSTAYSNPCITVYPRPIAGFSWGPQDVDVLTPTVNFYDQSVGATGANGILWYLGDVFLSDPQSNYTTVQNPVHSYENYDPYTYYVTQWVENSYGCADSVTQPVTILPVWTFYIPNAFSPNGDALNEGFKGTGIGIDLTTYQLWIFDRWGNQAFYSADMEEKWDGRMQGKGDDVLQEDIYVWKAKFQDLTGRKHEFSGTVSLIK